jgi:hypothetical protein
LTKITGYAYRKKAASERDSKGSEEENIDGNILLLNFKLYPFRMN